MFAANKEGSCLQYEEEEKKSKSHICHQVYLTLFRSLSFIYHVNYQNHIPLMPPTRRYHQFTFLHLLQNTKITSHVCHQLVAHIRATPRLSQIPKPPPTYVTNNKIISSHHTPTSIAEYPNHIPRLPPISFSHQSTPQLSQIYTHKNITPAASATNKKVASAISYSLTYLIYLNQYHICD